MGPLAIACPLPPHLTFFKLYIYLLLLFPFVMARDMKVMIFSFVFYYCYCYCCCLLLLLLSHLFIYFITERLCITFLLSPLPLAVMGI